MARATPTTVALRGPRLDCLADDRRVAVERSGQNGRENGRASPLSDRRRCALDRRPSTGRRPITSKNDPSDHARLTITRLAEAGHRVKSTVENSPKRADGLDARL